MPEFDIYQFEDRIVELVDAHHRLAAENRDLRNDYQTLVRCNAEVRKRLQALVRRLEALEQEAEVQRA